MLNLLKSDLYRIVRRADFWVFSALCALMMVAVAGMMAYFASPEFSMMVHENLANQADLTVEERVEAQAELDEARQDMAEVELLNGKEMHSVTTMWANTYLNGGFLGIVTAIFVALFLARDFKSGFIKNLNMSRAGRVRYYAEKLVIVALLDAFFLALCSVFSVAAFASFGFTFQVAESAGAVALWLFLAWLAMFAYSCLVACVVWLSRSEAVSIAFAVIVCSCVVGAFLVQLSLLLANAFPVFESLQYWTIVGGISMLTQGADALFAQEGAAVIAAHYPWGEALIAPWWQILLADALYVIIACVLAFAVCRKRNVA